MQKTVGVCNIRAISFGGGYSAQSLIAVKHGN